MEKSTLKKTMLVAVLALAGNSMHGMMLRTASTQLAGIAPKTFTIPTWLTKDAGQLSMGAGAGLGGILFGHGKVKAAQAAAEKAAQAAATPAPVVTPSHVEAITKAATETASNAYNTVCEYVVSNPKTTAAVAVALAAGTGYGIYTMYQNWNKKAELVALDDAVKTMSKTGLEIAREEVKAFRTAMHAIYDAQLIKNQTKNAALESADTLFATPATSTYERITLAMNEIRTELKATYQTLKAEIEKRRAENNKTRVASPTYLDGLDKLDAIVKVIETELKKRQDAAAYAESIKADIAAGYEAEQTELANNDVEAKTVLAEQAKSKNNQ